MGSSSAFTVGLLYSLYALRGQMPAKMQLAKESIHIEQNLLHETVGSRAQVMAAFGGLRHVTFAKAGTIPVDPIIISSERLGQLQSHLLLFYTGIARTASEVAGSFIARLDDCKKQLHILRELVDESIDILTSGMDIRAFGDLLHEAWQTKRTLSPKVSNREIDGLYARARSAGALGGKITGAGGGGFLLLFVPPKKQPAVLAALEHLIHVPFAFESAGSQIIFYEPGVDYQEAENARKQRPAAAFKEMATVS